MAVVSLPLVESDIRKRVDTDKVMSFGSFILWSIALSIFTLGIGLIVYYFIVAYQLVERRNQHFERQHSFCKNVIRSLREHFEAKGLDDRGIVNRAEAQLNDAIVREPQRNAWIWAVLLPILTLGLAGFYRWWFLTVDYRGHSVRQRELSDTISEALRVATGRGVTVVDESDLPPENCTSCKLTVLRIVQGGQHAEEQIYRGTDRRGAQGA